MIIGAGLLLAAGWVYTQLKNVANDLNFQLAAIGKINLRDGVLSAPVQIVLHNPASLGVTVDNLTCDISIQQKGGLWLNVGNIKPTGAFTVKPGDSSLVISPQVNFKAFGKNLIEAAANIATIQPTIKALVTVTVGGVPLQQEKIFTV